MPLCIIRSPQTKVNTCDKCCHVGIRCVNPLQQAQCSIMIAIFERDQSAVDGCKRLGFVRQSTPNSINQADRRLDRVALQYEANFAKGTNKAATSPTNKVMFQCTKC
jgi:hypothetical protein